MKYWELIAAELTRDGWSWGYVRLISSTGHTLFQVDAHRDNGKKYIVRTEELLTAFLQLQRAVRTA
jgi:hypothetical protein